MANAKRVVKGVKLFNPSLQNKSSSSNAEAQNIADLDAPLFIYVEIRNKPCVT